MGVDLGWVSERDHTEPDPEKALALAVILKAIEDATTGAGTTEADRANARAFLFAKDGDWARARRAWLAVADIDDGWLQRRLGEPPTDVPKDRRRMAQPREPSEWDRAVLDWLRAEGHTGKGHSELARVLNDAGFRAPRGGEVTADTTYWLRQRHKNAFAGEDVT